MKNSAILLFIILVSWLSVKATVLDFPLSTQEHDQWCWAGATQSIFHYYNLPITQSEIALYGTEGSNTWNYLWGYGELPTRRGIDMILNNFAGLQSVFGEQVNAIPLSQVIAEIDSLQPFVTRIGWYSGGGHFIDCYGYNQNNLYLMDPWPGNGFTIADYNWYVSGAPDFSWTHSLLLNSGTGLRAYFQNDIHNGYGPLTVNFTDYSLGTPTGRSWDFNNDDITDSNLTNPIWTFGFHTQYPVSLTVTKNNETHTYTVNNCVDVYDYPPVVTNPIPDIVMGTNTTWPAINLNSVFNDADGDLLSFTFHNAQNHITGTIENGMLSITPNQDWTGTTVCYARCTDNYFHIVNEIFNVTVSDTDADDITVQVTKPEFTVYPNPVQSHSIIKVSNPTNELILLTLYNAKGQRQNSWTIKPNSSNNIPWNGLDNHNKALASGVYYLQQDTASYHQSKKFLIMR